MPSCRQLGLIVRRWAWRELSRVRDVAGDSYCASRIHTPYNAVRLAASRPRRLGQGSLEWATIGINWGPRLALNLGRSSTAQLPQATSDKARNSVATMGRVRGHNVLMRGSLAVSVAHCCRWRSRWPARRQRLVGAPTVASLCTLCMLARIARRLVGHCGGEGELRNCFVKCGSLYCAEARSCFAAASLGFARSLRAARLESAAQLVAATRFVG